MDINRRFNQSTQLEEPVDPATVSRVLRSGIAQRAVEGAQTKDVSTDGDSSEQAGTSDIRFKGVVGPRGRRSHDAVEPSVDPARFTQGTSSVMGQDMVSRVVGLRTTEAAVYAPAEGADTQDAGAQAGQVASRAGYEQESVAFRPGGMVGGALRARQHFEPPAASAGPDAAAE